MSKQLLLSSLALALTLAAGCARKPPAYGCQSDAQCPSGARCTAGVCAGDTRPTASLAEVGRVEEYALVQLDGSGSSDPDGDVAEHRWSVRSVDAPCAPPVVAGIEPMAQVRFGCAGTYEVTLVVRDALGMDSDPARREVTVTRSSGTAVVVAGPDLTTDHVCGGDPMRCRTTAPVQLAAVAADGVSLRWTVQPPAERPLDAHRSVTLTPGPTDRTATAEIVTDGAGISGDWIFRAEAVDAYGVIGAAHTRLSVRNQAPVVTFKAAGPFEHAFDAARSTFTSRGTIAWEVQDPDGDVLEKVSGIWRHVGDGDGAVFDGDFDGTGLSFTVAVPYAVPADGLKLRGGAGLLRQIELYALDANRTAGVGTFRVEIGNRPPVLTGGTFDTDVPHHFDAQRSMYLAHVRAGTFVDPDGDPIVDSTGPGVCGTLHASGNDVTVECALAFEGVPIVDRLAGTRTFSVPAQDPWDASLQVPLRAVTIRNSPPSLTAGAPTQALVDARITFADCGTDVYVGGAEFDVSVDVSDPDGDPVVVGGNTSPGGSFTPAGMVLGHRATVPLHFVQAPFKWHCYKGDEPPISTVTANDGAPTTVSGGNPPVRVGVSPAPNFHW